MKFKLNKKYFLLTGFPIFKASQAYKIKLIYLIPFPPFSFHTTLFYFSFVFLPAQSLKHDGNHCEFLCLPCEFAMWSHCVQEYLTPSSAAWCCSKWDLNPI